MLDRLTGMSVFSKVVASGSFTAAARLSGMSQTMVTKHVAALEERLGARLLHRTTRRLTLTDAGRSFHEACLRILADVEEAEADAGAGNVRPHGVLRLNVPFSFGIRQISPLLPAFQEAYPELDIELGLNDRVVDLIEEGWDVAVRIGTLAESRLIARKLAPARNLLCASPDYIARHGTPRTLKDLSRHNCLGYTLSQRHGTDKWPFGTSGEMARVSGNLRVNNGDVLVIAAEAGQGIIYQPSFLVGDGVRAGRLTVIELDQPVVDVGGVYTVFPHDRRPPAKVRALVDFLTAHFSPSPPWDEGLPI
ncbi:LysR family transcriptional regulator [Pseudochelatococcus contaminans]|uniref:DNA-binding transcriptional LysR family regulator n=1 Tax=Pseudochelatococcus contaminans TaxID=1538103 RepID=A0A7W5Z4J5_9HYPH|nr:LysR family transcriptional regulator [Pseudochelatococcus contaminans]MBB3810025.1 DNA-binding transcriptional LysR family regulator [Pseudochelatococcus contaminans]